MSTRSTTPILVAVAAVLALAAGLLGRVVNLGGTLVTPAPVDPRSVYDPVRAGEERPSGFRQLLPRDGIRPVYDPVFVPAAAVPWDDDDLVIGVAIDGDAKAYPVNFLNRREMVIDRLAGIPILVTW